MTDYMFIVEIAAALFGVACGLMFFNIVDYLLSEA